MADIRVPFANPPIPSATRADEIHAELREVLRCEPHSLRESVEALETEFATWLCTPEAHVPLPYTLGVASGTDAVELALRGFFSLNPDISPALLGNWGRPGHAGQDSPRNSQCAVVFAPSHAPVALASAIERAGALPMLVDVDPSTMTISPASLAQAVDEARHAGYTPAAVVALHLYGHPCHMRQLELVAQDAGLWILEDCAYAMGAEYCHRRVGTLSEAAAFSCAPHRNLWALGDAGLLSTAFQPLADELDMLRRLGAKGRTICSVPGVNSNLDPMEAAVLRVNLRHLEQDQQERKSIAQRYTDAFKGSRVQPPHEALWARHAWNMYVLRVGGAEMRRGAEERRESLRNFMLDNAIEVPIETIPPLHLQPAYRDRLLKVSDELPETMALFHQTLPLPIYPGMTDDQVQHVIDTVRRWQN